MACADPMALADLGLRRPHRLPRPHGLRSCALTPQTCVDHTALTDPTAGAHDIALTDPMAHVRRYYFADTLAVEQWLSGKRQHIPGSPRKRRGKVESGIS